MIMFEPGQRRLLSSCCYDDELRSSDERASIFFQQALEVEMIPQLLLEFS